MPDGYYDAIKILYCHITFSNLILLSRYCLTFFLAIAVAEARSRDESTPPYFIFSATTSKLSCKSYWLFRHTRLCCWTCDMIQMQLGKKGQMEYNNNIPLAALHMPNQHQLSEPPHAPQNTEGTEHDQTLTTLEFSGNWWTVSPL